jgi:hypothetical protein
LEKNSYSAIVCSIFVAFAILLLVSPINVERAFATTTTIFIDPPTLTVGEGQELPTEPFTVRVKVENVTDMVAWQVFIRFNSTVLNCSGVSVPADNVFAGKTIIAPDAQIDNTAGTILYGATTLTLYEYTGSGVLCEIQFRGLAPGNSTVKVTEEPPYHSYLEDPEGNDIPFTAGDGSVEVIPENFILIMVLTLIALTTVMLLLKKKLQSNAQPHDMGGH